MSSSEKTTVFDPEQVARMAKACKAASEERPDLDAEDIAKRVVSAASEGEQTTVRLKKAGVGES